MYPVTETNVMVGWMRSTWSCRDTGIEYAMVRVSWVPVSVWLNIVKLAWSRVLALLTGMENWSQSPAGEIVWAVILLAASHSWTREAVSGVGVTNASTY